MIYFFISFFFFSRDHLFHPQCAQTTLKKKSKNKREKERKKAQGHCMSRNPLSGPSCEEFSLSPLSLPPAQPLFFSVF